MSTQTDQPRSAIRVSNSPINIWPNMAKMLHPDLRWLVENQAEIVRCWPARHMPVIRPLKAWPDGRVRIEFVKTWDTFRDARRECEERIKARAVPANKEARDE